MLGRWPSFSNKPMMWMPIGAHMRYSCAPTTTSIFKSVYRAREWMQLRSLKQQQRLPGWGRCTVRAQGVLPQTVNIGPRSPGISLDSMAWPFKQQFKNVSLTTRALSPRSSHLPTGLQMMQLCPEPSPAQAAEHPALMNKLLKQALLTRPVP